MSTSTSETTPETKPKAPRKRAPRKTAPKSATTAPIKTVKRKIGDETHDWSNELGGIVRPFGPAKANEAQNDPVIVEETPTAPQTGKVPVDPIGEIALSEGGNATS